MNSLAQATACKLTEEKQAVAWDADELRDLVCNMGWMGLDRSERRDIIRRIKESDTACN